MTAAGQREVDQVRRPVVWHQQVGGVKVAVDDPATDVFVEDPLGELEVLGGVEPLAVATDAPAHVVTCQGPQRLCVHPSA